MRVFFLVISLFSVVVLAQPAEAGTLSAPGPSPSWTRMQKFEWYLGYMARAAQVCGNYDAASTLLTLARMTPYGGAGLATVMGDGFAGPVCGRINREAAEMAADEQRIRAHIEATYDCKGDGCHGQDLSDWQFHACGNSLKSDFAILGLEEDDIRAVTMLNPKKTGSDAAYQARIQFHSCQGSLYIDLTEDCVMEKQQTRGDCSFDGIERY